MSKFKPILDAVTDATTATIKPVRAAERLNPQKPAGSLGFIDEYEQTAIDLDKANQRVPSPKEVQDEIVRKEAEAFEQRRIARITDPTEETGITFTHRTPEEYKARIAQLEDPHYSVRSVQRATTGFEDFGEIDKFAESVEKAAIRDQVFQKQVVGKAMANPRFASRVKGRSTGRSY
jgi:hypothetical protein